MSWLDFALSQIPGVTFSGTPTNEDLLVALSTTSGGWSSEPAPKKINIVDAASSPTVARTRVGYITGSTTGILLTAIAKAAAAASQSGYKTIVRSGDAIAGLVTAGAAAGGNVVIQAGNAARLTSGNGNGGNVVVTPGTAVGSGNAGAFSVIDLGLTTLFTVAYTGVATALGLLISGDAEITGDVQIGGDLTVDGNSTFNETASFPSGVTSSIYVITGGAQWQSGAGSPETHVVGNKGDLYSRTDGGAGTCLYVKETTGGNTGWVAK